MAAPHRWVWNRQAIIVKKFGPFLLLIPIILLLAWLPHTVRGEGPPALSQTSHILSIVFWCLMFCVILGLNRRAAYTRLFVVLLVLAGAARGFYRFSAAEIGATHLVLMMAGICVFAVCAFILAPPVQRKARDEANPPA